MLLYSVKHGFPARCCCLSSINRLAGARLATTDVFHKPYVVILSSLIKQLLVIVADWYQTLSTGVSFQPYQAVAGDCC